MVFDEVQNCYPGAIDEEKVGDIGSPAFVGHDCFKPDVGAARRLVLGRAEAHYIDGPSLLTAREQRVDGFDVHDHPSLD